MKISKSLINIILKFKKKALKGLKLKELKDFLKIYGMESTQIKNIYSSLNIFLKTKNFDDLKVLLNIYPHPTFKDIETFNKDHTKKVVLNDIDYAGVDDRLYEIICRLDRGFKEDVYKDSISYLNIITQYENKEQKHTHKGAIFYNIGLFLFRKGRIEEALLFNHRGLKEDHMKHLGKYNFPKVDSYKMITLDKTLNNPVINTAIDFISNQFLGTFTFEELYNKFLDIPSSIKHSELSWLDHIAYFTKLIIQIQRYFSIPEDLLYSTLGELFISSIIGDICLLLESTCKLKLKGSLPNNSTFGAIYQELKKNHYSWRANFRNNDFTELNLSNTLTDIFNNKYGGSTDLLENSFCLSYGLRNKVLHNINALSILRENFKKIVKKQMEFFIEYVINK